jgi:hypothetical protein
MAFQDNIPTQVYHQLIFKTHASTCIHTYWAIQMEKSIFLEVEVSVIEKNGSHEHASF